MNFFDRFPRPAHEEPQPAPEQPRWARDEDVLGATVPAELVLARSDEAVVGLNGFTAYVNGFAFRLIAVVRQEDRRRQRFHLAFHRDFFDDGPPPPEFLRLGVLFADGSAAGNLGGRMPPHPDEEPSGPLLMQESGGGGGRRYDMNYWVWPLPPPGPVTFVAEWPAFGIAESRAELDAHLFRAAAPRARNLWSPG